MFDVFRLLIPVGHFIFDLFAEKNKSFKPIGGVSTYRQKPTSSFKIHFSWLLVCGWLFFKLINLAIDTVRLEKKYETAVATCTRSEIIQKSDPSDPIASTTKQQKTVTK